MSAPRIDFGTHADNVIALDGDGCLYNATYCSLVAAVTVKFYDKLCQAKQDASQLISLQNEIDLFIDQIDISTLNLVELHNQIKQDMNQQLLDNFFSLLESNNILIADIYSRFEFEKNSVASLRFTCLEMLSADIRTKILFKANTALVKKILDVAETGSVGIACFSNRYDRTRDMGNMLANGTTSIYTDIRTICNILQQLHPNLVIKPLMPTITDIFNNVNFGTNFMYCENPSLAASGSRLTKILFESSKLFSSMLFANLAAKHLYLVDDKDTILNNLHNAYSNHPTIIPSITIHMLNYSGNFLTEKHVNGSGKYSTSISDDIRHLARLIGYQFTSRCATLNALLLIDFSACEDIMNDTPTPPTPPLVSLGLSGSSANSSGLATPKTSQDEQSQSHLPHPH